MNKNTVILLGVLGLWLAIFVAIFEFHIGIPVRAMFLMAFLCAVWLAYWTIKTIRQNYRNNVEVLLDDETQPETNNNTQTENASSQKVSRTGE